MFIRSLKTQKLLVDWSPGEDLHHGRGHPLPAQGNSYSGHPPPPWLGDYPKSYKPGKSGQGWGAGAEGAPCFWPLGAGAGAAWTKWKMDKDKYYIRGVYIS